eukprot:COSAG01_NODE_292_length_19376_cov_61.487239_9_plen_87_part_00
MTIIGPGSQIKKEGFEARSKQLAERHPRGLARKIATPRAGAMAAAAPAAAAPAAAAAAAPAAAAKAQKALDPRYLIGTVASGCHTA